MIGRRTPPRGDVEHAPRGFDDFDLRLGDVMRGERATLGKSLLDVQRELKIKATYIAAIENADVAAFETPGFIAGYVRSYSRYLGLDPEWAYDTFCREAGFGQARASERAEKAVGPSPGPVYRDPAKPATQRTPDRDPIAQPRVSFAPRQPSPFASIEPRALGSSLVLVALIGGIGYGGWAVLQEIQRVQVAPVDRAPAAVAEMDPLEGAFMAEADALPLDSGIAPAVPDALDRLYRPRPLDTPVMVARDGPIAALDPERVGALAGLGDGPLRPSTPGLLPDVADPGTDGRAGIIVAAVTEALQDELAGPPRVTEDVPEVMLVAVRPAWVRVRAADGSILLEKTLQAGDTYVVPQMEEAPTLRAGAAGAVFFAVNGQTFGPAGPRGAVVDGIALASAALTEGFAPADVDGNPEAREAVRVAEARLAAEPAPPAAGQ